MNWPVIQKWITENAPIGVEKLAAKAGCSMATILRIKRTGKADIETMRKLAKVLGVTLDELCGDHEDSPPAA